MPTIAAIFEREIFTSMAEYEDFAEADLVDPIRFREDDWDDFTIEVFGRFIVRRPYLLETSFSRSFPAVVNKVVDEILELEGKDVEDRSLRIRYLKTLCRCAYDSSVDSTLSYEAYEDNHVLIAAIYLGKIEIFDHILARRKRPLTNFHSKFWGRLLHAATRTGNLQLIFRVLPQGVRPDNVTLEAAICSDNAEELVPILLEARRQEHYPLRRQFVLAMELQKQDVAHILLDFYMGDTRYFIISSPFFSNLIVELLVESFKASMDEVVFRLLRLWDGAHAWWEDKRHHSKLAFEACNYGHGHILQMLIERGARINGQMYEHPVFMAAVKGADVRCIKALLDAGEMLNDVQAVKALREAAPRPRSSEVVWFLLHRGAIKISQLDKGFTVTGTHTAHLITAAVQYGNIEFVKALVHYGVPVNNEDFYAQQDCPSPRVTAIAFRQTKMIEALKALGAKEVDPMDSIVARHFRSGHFPCDPPPPLGNDETLEDMR